MNASTMMIKSVHMINFMMNEDVVVDFGNRLNFICGPNGSGKSTVLCAILVGLCGDTKNLGRATAEKTFIKSGKDFLKLSVTLSYTSGARNDVVVSRRVTQTASTSSIDGRKLSKEDVLAWVQSQNIQFDNLCHFMAQTRVRFFAQLAQKPKDFLLQVEEAVGPPGQAALHRWLISQSSEKQIAEKNKEQILQELERAKEKQKALDVEMQRYQSLIVIQNQLESAENFRPHLLANTEQQRFDEKVLQIEPLKQEVAEKDRSLQGARNLVVQKKSEMNRAEKSVEDAGKSMRKFKEDATKKSVEVQNAAKDVDHAGDDLRAARREVEEHQTRRAQCLEEVERAKNAVTDARTRLDELRRSGNFDQMEREKKALNNDLRKWDHEMSEAAETKNRLQQDLNKLNGQLKATSNQRHRRFDLIMKNIPNSSYNQKFKSDVEKMYRFIEKLKDQNRFRGEVVGPLAMDLEFSEMKDAKVVQAILPWKQRYVFLFADKDDFQAANDFLMHERLTCVIFDTTSLSRTVRPPPLSQQQLKQLGAYSFAMDLVHDAPETIKVYLSQKLFFSNILVGPDAGLSEKLVVARQMSNNSIQMAIGVSSSSQNPSDVVLTQHRIVVRGTNVGQTQERVNEPACNFIVGRQPDTDTSAIQARIDGLSDEVEAARSEEEAAGNKMRSTRTKVREVEEKLRQPQTLEQNLKTLQRRYDEKVGDLKDLQSVEQLEQSVSKKAATLKKKTDAFAQVYAAAVNLQPQVRQHPG
jgi:chromosome segregation ATPase